ncbi:MAG TPA: DUF4350 domain-containing protein [Terracidiphilus sp.]|nr:DUF4350 domain-containing protein [Terracidiphilus sp.]
MKGMTSLDATDRRLMLWLLGGAIALAVLVGFLLPNQDKDKNPMPSTYLAGQHGARAAYEMLVRSGYPMERWERPLNELAQTAGPDTVVIFAEPYTREMEDVKAVRQIVERGGRVLVTGLSGGFLVPGGNPSMPGEFHFAACELEPDGLDPLASSGPVWMEPEASWQLGDPAYRVQYTCAGQPAVVEYDYGKGHVVWWASATPLENGYLLRGRNLDLLLNSLGPRAGRHFYWDESLHGEVRSNWSYAAGPALTLLRVGLVLLGVLLVLSFSRRSGPLRELAQPARAAPMEFVEALGSLYRNAGAAGTAVGVALERFRRRSLRLCGLRAAPMEAAELAAVLRRRFPKSDKSLEEDLAACEEAAASENLEPRKALKLVQALHGHMDRLRNGAQLGRHGKSSDKEESQPLERAS